MPGFFAVRHAEDLDERAYPTRPVLHGEDPESREPGQKAVADERRDGVEDAPALEVHDVEEGGRPDEGQVLSVAAALPQVVIAGHPVVRGVHPDRDVELGDLGPERVELREGEGAVTLVPRHRARPDEDDLGASLGDPVELADGFAHDREGDHGGGVYAVLEVEGPVLVHPLIEGMDHGVRGLRVVA